MSQHLKAVRPKHIDPCNNLKDVGCRGGVLDNLKDVGCHGGAPDNIKDEGF
jgi:hypothetical protein